VRITSFALALLKLSDDPRAITPTHLFAFHLPAPKPCGYRQINSALLFVSLHHPKHLKQGDK